MVFSTPFDSEEQLPGSVEESPDGVQKAAWCEGAETGLAHLVTFNIMPDVDSGVCGVIVIRPRPDDTEENPRCSACREMFAGELIGFF